VADDIFQAGLIGHETQAGSIHETINELHRRLGIRRTKAPFLLTTTERPRQISPDGSLTQPWGTGYLAPVSPFD